MDEKLLAFEKVAGFICPVEFWPALAARPAEWMWAHGSALAHGSGLAQIRT